jgi:hypothetical protein
MTAEVLLATLIALFPPGDDPGELRRYATVAVAGEVAIDEQMARGWHKSRRDLEHALVTALRFEAGGLDRDVHSGANSKNGFCLTQIHHTNGRWRDVVSDPHELTGTDYGSTLNCFRVAVRTLAGALRYCTVPSKRQPDRYITNWRTAMWSAWGTGHSCWISRTAGARSRYMRGLGTESEPTPEMYAIVHDIRVEYVYDLETRT